MKTQASIGPHTNFDEIFTYFRCPAKLYLQLAGYRSEVERRYSPPTVSPAMLGREGENMIERAYKRQLEVWIPDIAVKEFTTPKGELKKSPNESK